MKNDGRDGIVLLHGQVMLHPIKPNISMKKLAQFLESHDYHVLNLSYPFRALSIEEIAEHIHPPIRDFAARVPTVHFVGFSEGGVVERRYIHVHRPENLGRVVQMATPNHGSHLADLVYTRMPGIRRLGGKSGEQLKTDALEQGGILGPIDYELGSIAGDSRKTPSIPYVLPRPHDGRVSVESTRVEGMADHIVIHANHTYFPHSRKAWRQVLAFLEEGKFQHPETDAEPERRGIRKRLPLLARRKPRGDSDHER